MSYGDAVYLAVAFLVIILGGLVVLWRSMCPQCGKFFSARTLTSRRKDRYTSHGDPYFVQWDTKKCRHCGYLWRQKSTHSDEDR